MAILLLVRHADAGDRNLWTTDQDLRPLTELGRRQAASVAALLARYEPRRILSSPAVRCSQTVEPLAAALGVEIETVPELREGLTTDALVHVGGTPMALASHGDVLPELLHVLAAGLDGVDRSSPFDKGATWVLDLTPDGKTATSAEYVVPSV